MAKKLTPAEIAAHEAIAAACKQLEEAREQRRLQPSSEDQTQTTPQKKRRPEAVNG
jgi:hypothetical protein